MLFSSSHVLPFCCAALGRGKNRQVVGLHVRTLLTVTCSAEDEEAEEGPAEESGKRKRSGGRGSAKKKRKRIVEEEEEDEDDEEVGAVRNGNWVDRGVVGGILLCLPCSGARALL